MDVVYATQEGWVTLGGASVHITYGTHWRADDPVVLAYPGYFSDDPRVGMHYSDPQNTTEPQTIPNKADAAWNELQMLRAQAEQVGIKVDRRWSIARLREELEARKVTQR